MQSWQSFVCKYACNNVLCSLMGRWEIFYLWMQLQRSWYNHNIYFVFALSMGNLCLSFSHLIHPSTIFLRYLAWFLGTANSSGAGSKVARQSCGCVTYSNCGAPKTQVSQTYHPNNTCTSGCQQGHDQPIFRRCSHLTTSLQHHRWVFCILCCYLRGKWGMVGTLP